MRPIPTLIELRNQIANDLRNKLNLSDDDLRKVIDAFSSVQAAQMKILYLYLSDVQRNLFPDTADLAINGGQLERLGLIYLNRQPNSATSGIYTANVTGDAAAVIRAGLTFKSNDDSKSPGFLFVTDAETVLTGANDTIEIRALVPGLVSHLSIANKLTITEPVIGVSQVVSVAAIIEEPKSAEETSNYRQAILDAIQLEPQGGARTDYKIWSSDAQGVRKVYSYVKQNEAGVVQIYVEATLSDSLDGLGTPSALLLQDVLDVCELDPDVTKPLADRGRRPIGAQLETLPIILKPVEVEIVGINESNAQIQSDILNVIESFLYNVRPYVVGADLARNKNDILYSGRLQSAVTEVLSPTNFFNDFIMKVDGVELVSTTFDGGNIPYLESIIYT
jgi:uncharacterized phage protein gp47/JayE